MNYGQAHDPPVELGHEQPIRRAVSQPFQPDGNRVGAGRVSELIEQASQGNRVVGNSVSDDHVCQNSDGNSASPGRSLRSGAVESLR